MRYGFNVPEARRLSRNQLLELFTSLRESNARMVRLDVRWGGVGSLLKGVQNGPNSYDWGQIDTMVKAAIDSDLSPLLVLQGPRPSWGKWQAKWPFFVQTNGDATEYGKFCEAIASRYANQVTYFEIWNEPNSWTFWLRNPSATEYVKYLKAAYAGIKAGSHTAMVVGGALAIGESKRSTLGAWMEPVGFLNDIYLAGGGPYFDILSYHPYSVNVTKLPWAQEFPSFTQKQIAKLPAMRAIMDEFGDTEKLIWITEAGVDTASVNQAEQRKRLEELDTIFKAWESKLLIDRVIWHGFRDDPSGGTSVERSYGIQDKTGKAKLAYETMRDRMTP